MKKKRFGKEKIKEYRTHLFAVLGFFGAALVMEVVNIVHEFAKSMGSEGFLIYSLLVIFVALPCFMYSVFKLLDSVYLSKSE